MDGWSEWVGRSSTSSGARRMAPGTLPSPRRKPARNPSLSNRPKELDAARTSTSSGSIPATNRTASTRSSNDDGVPSDCVVNFEASTSSDTRRRRAPVSPGTITVPMRSATGSRVRASTGRSPPWVAANHFSPRSTGPVRLILGGTLAGDRGDGQLAVGVWCLPRSALRICRDRGGQSGVGQRQPRSRLPEGSTSSDENYASYDALVDPCPSLGLSTARSKYGTGG